MITALIALVVSAALVAAAVRFALRPLDSMAALAKTVSQGNRGYRLAPTRTDTELGQTAQAFDEMLDELEGAETRAQQAEERTRAFLADAAHELRTPIAGVQAAAETLLHHDDQLDHDERQHLQALMVREAERAGALISDLLTAARLDAGSIWSCPVSLFSLAHSEIDRVQLLHPGTAVTISGPEVIAHADAAKVSSILRNVIDNAVRAAGPDGQVHLIVREHDQFAIAEIWDSGPGVPPSQRERIFERLVRLDHGRASDSGGSGLGLAIARGYARAHGGDLTCEDPRGSGAMFRLVLPLEPRDVTPLSSALSLYHVCFATQAARTSLRSPRSTYDPYPPSSAFRCAPGRRQTSRDSDDGASQARGISMRMSPSPRATRRVPPVGVTQPEAASSHSRNARGSVATVTVRSSPGTTSSAMA
jgi:signal transduction histidine kinase